jgi:hypothetical protein
MAGTKQIALPRPEKTKSASEVRMPLGIVLLLALTVPAWAQRSPLPEEEQKAVNKAIDRGVEYLKQTQQKKGTWAKPTEHHKVGYAVLPALTLLECGVSPKDPLIQKAAEYLRAHAPTLDTTYELSLGILFLDRLGEEKDDKLIQTFALRLIAGQSATGGWGYKCMLLQTGLQKDLLAALRHFDPPKEDMPLLAEKRPGQPGIGGGVAKKPEELVPIARDPKKPPLSGSTAQDRGGSLGGGTSRSEGSPSSGGSGSTVDGLTDKELQKPANKEKAPPAPPNKTDAKKGKPADKSDKPKSDKPYVLPERLGIFPVIQNPDLHVLQDPKGKAHELIVTTTDNSNTQFAILALWTARRHGVPMTRTLNLVVRRFLTSQNLDGSWGYHYFFGGGDPDRPAMTCVGLIGLAVGHGLAQPQPAGQRVQDPRIVNGLIALSKHVGKPADDLIEQPMQNLYFLWSVERVAVLYNMPKIGDKDWYRWGAQVLVVNQQKPGNWTGGQYHGNSPVLDTCLALLFLKRANLVKDLTAKLPFQAEDLNKSILRTNEKPVEKAPEVPKKPPVVEKVTETETVSLITKPAPAPVSQETAPSGDGKRKWIVLSLAAFLLFAVGSVFLLLSARRQNEVDDDNRGKSKVGNKKRRLPSTASRAD